MNPQPAKESVRIDKWLWAVRIYKTRAQAADACRQGHVTIGANKAKPSREVKPGEIIVAAMGEITRTLRVLKPLERRVAAPAAKEAVEDLTPASEYQKRREPRYQPLFVRPKGAGRPTKKQRRDLDNFDPNKQGGPS